MKLFIVALLAFASTAQAQVSTGASTAGGSDSSAGCSAIKADSQVSKYCEDVYAELKDSSSCAGKAFQDLQKVDLPQLDDLCSGLKNDRLAQFVAVSLASMTCESDGVCTAAGDGGTPGGDQSKGSHGLFQCTNTDAPECKANLQDPKENIKCGLCIAWKEVAESKKLFGGSGNDAVGWAKKYGPFRPDNPSHSKQMETISKVCGGGSGKDSGAASPAKALQ